jgi:hypothetical protein
MPLNRVEVKTESAFALRVAIQQILRHGADRHRMNYSRNQIDHLTFRRAEYEEARPTGEMNHEAVSPAIL